MVEEKPKARAVSKTVTGCLRFQAGSGPSSQPCLAADRTEKKQRSDTELRIRAFCPGIFAFLAAFRAIEKKGQSSCHHAGGFQTHEN